jgi:hypothetical protein
MDFFEGLLSQIVPKVAAQGAAIAQPTFGTITTTPSTSELAKVELNTATTTQTLGQNFTVEVVVNSNTIPIREYQIVLQFPTNSLSVVDAYPNEEGSQVEFLDDVFDVISQGNRVVSDINTGLTTINKTVARITFQPQRIGTTELKHLDTIAGTVLYNQQGIALSTTRNDLTLVIQNTTGTTTVSTTSTVSSTTSTISSSTTSQGGNEIPVDTIPDTGIFDGNNLPFILGVLLVLLGISINSERKKLRGKPNSR